MRILITGGCGFLGQYVIKDILAKFPDASIRVLDLKANKEPIFNYKNNPKVEILLNRDITEYNSIRDDFKDVDIVIHLAGIVSFSIKDKELLYRVNVDGTKNIVKAVNDNNINSTIHISSVAALGYNDDEHSPINESFKFDWSIAEKNKKYYMLTKHLADVFISESVKNNVLILYPGLMLGPGDITNSAKLITAIKNGRIPFNMPGGTNIVDVRDVSRGIVNSISKSIKKGEYLLSGHNLLFKEVNSIIAKELDVQPPKFTLPRVLNSIMFKLLLILEQIAKNKLELTADNVDSAFKFRYFSNKLAKDKFNWETQIPFEQTIKETINWMKKYELFK